jgi:uncharacterized protein
MSLPDNIQAVLDRQEELNPDLVPYLGEVEVFGEALRHPLVFGVPYSETMNALYNEQYKAKCQYRDKAAEEKNWGRWIFIHEKPYRFQKLLELVDNVRLPDKEFWEIFGSCWTNTENMWQMESEIRELLEFGYQNPHTMMEDEERKLFDSLPDEFTVYRGHQGCNEEGLSWTLSSWRARWFANRWGCDNGEVSVATCSKDVVIGIFLGRGELEVGVLPEELLDLRDFEPIELPPLVQEAKDQSNLGPQSYHGFSHWDNVARNVQALCDKTPEADLLVCQLFAVLHDCKRQNEDDDPQHGPRAAGFVKKLHRAEKLGITSDQFDQLFHAVYHHTDGALHDDPTVGVCWDADRMDLPRVNIIPNPKFFSTEAAKELMWRI